MLEVQSQSQIDSAICLQVIHEVRFKKTLQTMTEKKEWLIGQQVTSHVNRSN